MTVPLFVELCAGTAALSLRLHARGARPPVSRMGAKTGYADAILRVLGLAPGARAAHYLWCEPDPGVRLLLEAYRDADLARAAAGIIRGWAGEEPRALWERLRAEGPPVLPATGPELARWARIITANRLIPVHHDGVKWCNSARNTPGAPTRGGLSFGGDDYCTPIAALAEGFDAAPTLPATIHPDARTVDPREVARWAWLVNRTMPQTLARGATDGGFNGGNGKVATAAGIAAKMERYTLPATITPDARDVHPPALPPGTVCYMDPPYVGTTGYASDLPRSEVVALARRWQAAGARVCVSEAEPIPELVADGWHAVRIDGERQGQKRTFSRQQAEWLTLSHPPAWRPSVQAGLFG